MACENTVTRNVVKCGCLLHCEDFSFKCLKDNKILSDKRMLFKILKSYNVKEKFETEKEVNVISSIFCFLW